MESALHVGPWGYAAALSIVLLGAVIQGSVGFGANMVAAPVVAIIQPEAVPAVLMIMVVPLVVGMVRREHHGIDWPVVGWIVVGRVPGTVVGALVVAAVSGDTLSVLAGAGVLVAVTLSVLSATVPVTGATSTGAGFASGLLGTATSIGGPPVALLLQHRPGPVLRSTLAATFMIGTALSVAVLVLAGEVAPWQVALAAALVPGTLTGLMVSSRVARHIDGPRLRPAVLVFAATTAVVAVVRGLV